MALLEVKELVKHFPTRAEPLVILNGVDLAVDAGENVAILGPSGSGKSTLLHIMGTLDEPTSGTVRINGLDPFGLSSKKLAQFRNDNIGFVFQEHHLLPQLSVLENVLVPALAFGKAGSVEMKRAEELIDRVGLADRKTHRPGELSGGERQRVAVARALLRQPALVLADEPTGSLDQANAGDVGNLLLELYRDEQTALVVVTHSLTLAEMFQRSLALNEGMLQANSTQPANPT